MSSPPLEPKWPRLLSLSVHEFRTPISVVAGYLRMVLKDPAATLDERYRWMLEQAEKSCGRLSALTAEMSDLSALEAGTAAFKKAPVDIRSVLTAAIDALPPLPDRSVTVELRAAGGPAVLQADGPRLQSALTSVLHGLRREVVTSDKLIVNERTAPYNGQSASWIAIADAENIEAVSGAQLQDLTVFDEWRGGCGLSLAVARRVIDRHHGSIWSPATSVKTAALIALPH
jgi:two-component system, OmpR family, phosphate regulon sensor histidine kinase PhoR